MANLVPLYIDKDTGEIKAQGGAISSAGGGQGYLYQQIVADNVWLIEHNAGTENLLTQIYNVDGIQVFPDSLTIVDINTVQIIFGAPQDGSAHLVFFTTV